MSAFTRIVMLAAPLAAMLVAGSAAAETLIYVTDTTIGTVDSADPSTDDTSSNNNAGPLSYALPNGATVIGAHVSLENKVLYLLTVNGGNCQLYSTGTTGTGSASVIAVGASYPCAPAPGTGDFAFLNGTGSATVADAYLVANGSTLLDIPAGGGAPGTISFTNPGGGAAALWGVADAGSGASAVQYGVDAGTQEIVTLSADSGSGVETNTASAPVTYSGSTALDYSTTSSTLYLYTGGQLYAYGGTPYPNSPSVGDLSELGTMPGGTLAMAVANGAQVSNNGGAFAPALLLPLLLMAGLRRRRRLIG